MELRSGLVSSVFRLLLSDLPVSHAEIHAGVFMKPLSAACAALQCGHCLQLQLQPMNDVDYYQLNNIEFGYMVSRQELENHHNTKFSDEQWLLIKGHATRADRELCALTADWINEFIKEMMGTEGICEKAKDNEAEIESDAELQRAMCAISDMAESRESESDAEMQNNEVAERDEGDEGH